MLLRYVRLCKPWTCTNTCNTWWANSVHLYGLYEGTITLFLINIWSWIVQPSCQKQSMPVSRLSGGEKLISRAIKTDVFKLPRFSVWSVFVQVSSINRNFLLPNCILVFRVAWNTLPVPLDLLLTIWSSKLLMNIIWSWFTQTCVYFITKTASDKFLWVMITVYSVEMTNS